MYNEKLTKILLRANLKSQQPPRRLSRHIFYVFYKIIDE